MRRGDLDDLAAFATVARVRSFTRAGADLGLSPSALSHAMKALNFGSGYVCSPGRHALSRRRRLVSSCCDCWVRR